MRPDDVRSTLIELIRAFNEGVPEKGIQIALEKLGEKLGKKLVLVSHPEMAATPGSQMVH